jgi:hypothetical protein
MGWGKRWYWYFSAGKKEGAETNGAQREFARPILYSKSPLLRASSTTGQKIEDAEPDLPLTLAPV